MLKRALALQPVTSQELQESLQILRYDMHKEVQGIVKEQIRQFALAKVRGDAAQSHVCVSSFSLP